MHRERERERERERDLCMETFMQTVSYGEPVTPSLVMLS
jgi:hypothetical protein